MSQSTPFSAPGTALIIGAGGSFGLHVTAALLMRGWQIRALARDPAAAAIKAGANTPIDWVKGDAMVGADVMAAAQGAQLIVHAANPPRYHNWSGLARQMLASSIAAAKANGARIVLPGTVYNYAPDAGPSITETAPQTPVTRKGKIRVEMEAMLRDASTRGAKVLIVRAGDFVGPAAPNSALSWLVRRGKGRVKAVFAPGPVGVGHAFAYLPDLAETTARLIEREAELADFAVFHFKGYWLGEDDDLVSAIRRVTGQAKLRGSAFPWPLIAALSPLVEMFRELLEMRYLWRMPIGLDNSKLIAFLGAEPTTPLDTALRASLQDIGCLEDKGDRDRPSHNWTLGTVRP